MPSIIAPVYKSIVRATTDMIDELNQSQRFGEVGYHNWESRGDENTLPQITLIGLDGFGFNENEGRWMIRYAMGVSSFRDFNLLSEIDLIDTIQQRFGQGKKVSLLDMDTGEMVNELVVSDFDMLPMGQSQLRNYRTIGLELLRTGT